MIDDEATLHAGDATPAAADAATAEAPQPTTPSRYRAPDHTTAMSFSTGRVIAVENGILAVPDDLTASERETLTVYGFTAA